MPELVLFSTADAIRDELIAFHFNVGSVEASAQKVLSYSSHPCPLCF